eukprot:CAMPEP_0175100654 /NCGR_PEP_ID=MMETSP0086_2-20121207/7257_1 /TAXON_ID=136419 /ORGANISM="Unknown Unknown, Strain D1" /LENGTH=184 /DNA_ID=CAMNT_0016374889 /DNA_START=18 /DNA_END=572 /DNA_ORIENTATION=+
MDFANFQALGELLAQGDSEEHVPIPQKDHNAADDLFKTVLKTRNEDDEADTKPKEDPKAIWKEEEVRDELPEGADENDGRTTPEFEILYGQNISSQDCYLNMGFKDSSTSCCGTIVVVIELPGTRFKDVVLDVTPHKLLCRSPKFKLFLDLPETVDSDEGSAKFVSEKSQLRVTLPITDRKDDV